MDFLCPDIERLVACYICYTQTLPPYRLCLNAHVVCPPCFKYLQRCSCGMNFDLGPHIALDWVVQAMKLKCRHAMARNNGVSDSAVSVSSESAGSASSESTGEGGRRVGFRAAGGNGSGIVPSSDDVDDCDDRWYRISDLIDHYRSGCRKNIFTCPLPDCGHVGRIDTIVEHYEDAHGPIEQIAPDNPLRPNSITYKIDCSVERFEPVIHKVFNGYFLLIPKMLRRGISQNFVAQNVSLQNINPSDPLQYVSHTSMVAEEVTVNISLNESPNF